jgi:hypothetical protein
MGVWVAHQIRINENDSKQKPQAAARIISSSPGPAAKNVKLRCRQRRHPCGRVKARPPETARGLLLNFRWVPDTAKSQKPWLLRFGECQWL